MTKKKPKQAPQPKWRSWRPNERDDRELSRLLDDLRAELATDGQETRNTPKK